MNGKHLRALISDPTVTLGWMLCIVLLVHQSAMASKSWIYTARDSNVAVSGYDTVSYFTDGRPTKGNLSIFTDYQGARWLFKNAHNREMFLVNPEKYAPQYGGYCAFSVAQGSALKADPRYWEITNGKLYLNRTQRIHERWLDRQSELEERASKNWPAVLEGQLESPFRREG